MASRLPDGALAMPGGHRPIFLASRHHPHGGNDVT